MRSRQVFAKLTCVIFPQALSGAEQSLLACCLRDAGASIVTDATALAVTHVICHPSVYAQQSPLRNIRFVAIVRPEWVFRSFLLQRLLPVDRFSANPAHLFASLVFASGAIGKDQCKVFDGLITHFGGQIIDKAENYDSATHVLTWDDTGNANVPEPNPAFHLSFTTGDITKAAAAWTQWLAEKPMSLEFAIPSCLIAQLGGLAGLTEQHHVKYTWVEECVNRKTRVPEGPFVDKSSKKTQRKKASWKTSPEVRLEDLELGKCAEVYKHGAAGAGGVELSLLRKTMTEKMSSLESVLSGAIVLVAQHIPPQVKEHIVETLKSAHAKVANVPLGDSYEDIVRKVVTNASFVVCRYQSGVEYEEALRQNKRIVSIYWVLSGQAASNQSRFQEIIHRPTKSVGGIPGMQGFIVTLSGYSSRTSPTREEVHIAIHAAGACMLPVLSRTHSTHLLCVESKGEKFKKAQSWRFENILSHEWLFECLKQWKHVNEESFRLTSGSSKELDTSAQSTASKQVADGKENATPVPNQQNTGPAKLSKRASSTPKVTPAKTRGGAGRFDVDDMLVELDEKNTPRTGNAEGVAVTPSVPKATPCKLFDTPTQRIAQGEVEEEPEAETTVNASEAKTSQKKAKTSRARGKKVTTDSSESIEILEAKPIRKRKAADVSKVDSEASTASTKDVVAVVAKSAKTKTASKAKAAGKPAKKAKIDSAMISNQRVFLLTGTREELAVNESIVISLGGNVSQVGRKFDSTSTHIICSELKRTEKFVCGCTAGKWILKPSYLEASAVAGHFVDEAPHEWGHDTADTNLMDPRIWPKVASYWRTERAAGKPGAFAGWRFLVHSKTVPPSDMCERIIAASEGTVIPLNKSLDLAAEQQTATAERPLLALVPPGLPSRDTWLKKFKAEKIECINASFLIDYITKDPSQRPSRAEYHL